MSFVNNINKKLSKAFNEKVEAFVNDDGCLVLSGELARHSEVVAAGLFVAREKPSIPIINDIVCTSEKEMKPRGPVIVDSALEFEETDVLIIGGGIIGCAIARELSKYKLKILLVDKEFDVAVQASGRNTGVIHSSVGLKKGSRKKYLTWLGNQKLDELCSDLSVPLNRCGQHMIYTNPLWRQLLFISKIYWAMSGIKGGRVLRGAALHATEPAIASGVGSSLFCPGGGVVDPHLLTIALAENALANGVDICLNTIVQEMKVENGRILSVKTNRGTVIPKIVINAAGVFSEHIAAMAGDRFYSIRPIKGTIAVIDRKYANKLINSVATIYGKVRIGKKKRSTNRKAQIIGSIVRSIHKTILAGPYFIETIHKEDFSTSFTGVDGAIAQSKRVLPDLEHEQIIKTFSGTCGATYEDDFVISRGHSVKNLIHAAGITFPGVTASPAIAEDIANIVKEIMHNVEKNPEFQPKREPPPVVKNMDSASLESLIINDYNYGIPVCHCEKVTRGEINEALHRDFRCDNVDSVRHRLRVGCGSCQGQHCLPLLHEIIIEEKHSAPQHVRKNIGKSEYVYGDIAVIAKKQSDAIAEARIEHKHELEREYD